ncbi:methyltransferase domain-containing protein [Lewinella sp. 4G2]|uniref:methyltransferase domain-containing protein n=1 Tax=Lewinella sp. 4G2 TaxID=1803372 RepID=UPI0007B49DB8|nr:methyltransferase domain-containing protein [Lewinella sp. 4G2]OAV45690.1 hypothetical protein A3850_014845 [Lewinella sp. 4G2]
MSYKDINRKAYNELADHYKKRRSDKGQYEESSDYLAGLLHSGYHVSINECRVLEIGPGAGNILRCFENLGSKVFAVELSENIIELCKEIAPNTIYFNRDVFELDFGEDKFDLVYMGAIIHLFPKNMAFPLLKKVRHWIKPSGRLFLNTTISNKSSEGIEIKKDAKGQVARYRSHWSETEFSSLIDKLMMDVIRKSYTLEMDRDKKWLGITCVKPEQDIVEDEPKFKGKTLSILNRKIKLNNQTIDFEVINRPKVALIIPFIDSDTIIFTRQFRSAINQYVLELPAGKSNFGEKIEETAMRELQEETGYTSSNLTYLTSFYSSLHMSNEKIYVFIAKDLVRSEKSLGDKEFIKLEKRNIFELVDNNVLIDAKSYIAIAELKKLIYDE